jgi:hypothetical protein
MMACAGLLLSAAAAALVLGQRPHVVRTLAVLGIVLAATFGSTLPALRDSYRDAEVRKMAAADL